MVCNQRLTTLARYSWLEVTFGGYLQTAVCFVGVVCNIFNVWVLSDKRLNRSPTFTFLTYLSICDAITLLCLVSWSLAEVYYVSQSWAEQLSVITWPIMSVFSSWSVLLTAALTVDRCIQIKRLHVSEEDQVIGNWRFNRGHAISLALFIVTITINAPRLAVFYFNSETGCRQQYAWAKDQGGWFFSYSVLRLIIFKMGKHWWDGRLVC